MTTPTTEAVVVLTTVGFHAQATAIKPKYVNEFVRLIYFEYHILSVLFCPFFRV